jgi:hypothetical protein
LVWPTWIPYKDPIRCLYGILYVYYPHSGVYVETLVFLLTYG